MRRIIVLIAAMAILCVYPAVAQESTGQVSKAANDAYNAYNRAVDFNNKADGTWGVSSKTEWYTFRAISEILVATYLQNQKLIEQNKEIIKLLKEKQK